MAPKLPIIPAALVLVHIIKINSMIRYALPAQILPQHWKMVPSGIWNAYALRDSLDLGEGLACNVILDSVNRRLELLHASSAKRASSVGLARHHVPFAPWFLCRPQWILSAPITELAD